VVAKVPEMGFALTSVLAHNDDDDDDDDGGGHKAGKL